MTKWQESRLQSINKCSNELNYFLVIKNENSLYFLLSLAWDLQVLRHNNQLKQMYMENVIYDSFAATAENDDFWFEDEKMNLDENLPNGQVIIAYASLGLWDGRHVGGRIVGNRIANILRQSYDNKWFCDRYNVRCNQSHHDGTNYILYRIVPDIDTAERIMRRCIDEKWDEAKFRKNTRSLRPYVAKIYGW